MKHTPLSLLLSCSLAHAIVHAYVLLLPPLLPLIKDEFNLTFFETGAVSSSFYLTYAFLGFPLGLIADWYSRKILAIIGLITASIATLITASSANFTQLLICQAVGGVGVSTYHPIGDSLISQAYSRERRGRAMGIHLGIGNVGSFITPIITGVLMLTIGWRNCFILFGFPGLFAALVFWLLVEEKRGPTSLKYKSSLKLKQLFMNRELIILSLVMAASSLRYRGITTFIPLLAVSSYGIDASKAAMLLGLMFLVGIIAPVIGGALSDRFGRKNLTVSLFGITSLFTYLLVSAQNISLFTTILLLFGFTLTASGSIIAAFAAEVVPEEQLVLAFSLLFTVGTGIGTLFPPLVGYIVDVAGFYVAFVFLAILSGVGAILALGVKEPSKR